MDKYIQELTENERFLNYCEALDIDPQKYMQECYHNIAIHSDEYKKLEAENKRLKEQLDREIKINRKMKSALEKYADEKNWDSYGNDWKFGVYKDFENDDYPEYTDEKLAKQVLKEIDNKE